MNIEKLIQSCNYLIKKNNFSMNYTKLIKLLYLADKESLRDSGQTITGDAYVSMDNGPVLSHLYDLIRGLLETKDAQAQALWNSRFMRDKYDLVAVSDRIPDSELSRFEKRILDGVYDKFKEYDFGAMIDYVHNNCPEWANPNGSSIAIDTRDILKSVGKTDEEIEWILEEIKSFEHEDAIFSQLSGI
jgi:uncharacterized phage-associated protein